MSVSPELHAFVLRRDRACVLALVSKVHVCRDAWGEVHDPLDMGKLTVEHVRGEPGGARHDDAGHLVAMCAWSNTNHDGSTTEHRHDLNVYLAGVRAGESVCACWPAVVKGRTP